jgi:hypothetical protein
MQQKFVRERNGKAEERIAGTPAEAVALQFDGGWRPVDTDQTSEQASEQQDRTAAKSTTAKVPAPSTGPSPATAPPSGGADKPAQ